MRFKLAIVEESGIAATKLIHAIFHTIYCRTHATDGVNKPEALKLEQHQFENLWLVAECCCLMSTISKGHNRGSLIIRLGKIKPSNILYMNLVGIRMFEPFSTRATSSTIFQMVFNGSLCREILSKYYYSYKSINNIMTNKLIKAVCVGERYI